MHPVSIVLDDKPVEKPAESVGQKKQPGSFGLTKKGFVVLHEPEGDSKMFSMDKATQTRELLTKGSLATLDPAIKPPNTSAVLKETNVNHFNEVTSM